jgi:hypothetical protein
MENRLRLCIWVSPGFSYYPCQACSLVWPGPITYTELSILPLEVWLVSLAVPLQWNFYKLVLFIASDSPCIPSSSTGQTEVKPFMKFPPFATGKLARMWFRSESGSLGRLAALPSEFEALYLFIKMGEQSCALGCPLVTPTNASSSRRMSPAPRQGESTRGQGLKFRRGHWPGRPTLKSTVARCLAFLRALHP